MDMSANSGERRRRTEPEGMTEAGAALDTGASLEGSPPGRPIKTSAAGEVGLGSSGKPADDGRAPEAAPEPACSAELADLVGRLADLAERFEERIANDRFKERQISQLHEELQSHRQDLVGRVLRPLLLGLIRLHDDFGRAREHLGSTSSEEFNRDRADAILEGFQDDVEVLLDQHGVIRSTSVELLFEPRLQTAVRTVPTDDLDQVGRIVRCLRPGFELNGAPLQKERVEVYVAAEVSRPASTPEAAHSRTNQPIEEDLQ